MVKLVVTFGFLISFAAGLVVGMQRGTSAPAAMNPPSTRPFGPRGFLPAALNLTPDQQEKMKQIWADEGNKSRTEQSERRNACRKERDDAILGMLTPDQKTQYDDIQKTYREKNDAIDHDLRADFQRKVEETNKILTPEQQAKYQELLSHRQPFERQGFDRGDRGPRDHGDRGFNRLDRRGEDRATSQPRPQP
jgi:Spy/CpxP family protein refolding chaperone